LLRPLGISDLELGSTLKGLRSSARLLQVNQFLRVTTASLLPFPIVGIDPNSRLPAHWALVLAETTPDASVNYDSGPAHNGLQPFAVGDRDVIQFDGLFGKRAHLLADDAVDAL
jgi:hypothetical protein